MNILTDLFFPTASLSIFPAFPHLLLFLSFFLSRDIFIAFICPYCPKCFSRSDNLNQHIRVHRHDREKAAAAAAAATPKSFTNFTPFLGPTEKAGDRL